MINCCSFWTFQSGLLTVPSVFTRHHCEQVGASSETAAIFKCQRNLMVLVKTISFVMVQ